MDPNLLWFIPVVGFFVLEAWGLWKDRDRMQPLTYWIRHVFGLGRSKAYFGPGWWIVAAILGWLAIHFLVASG